MKIITAKQTQALDAYTIRETPIASIDLMERAAMAFCDYFLSLRKVNCLQPIYIFCGPGNNGGDGLAIGRILFKEGYNIQIISCEIGKRKSEDFKTNFERLPGYLKQQTIVLQKGQDLIFPEGDIYVIDAIFGTGLSRPVTGYWGDVIRIINQKNGQKFSVDIPSGLYADQSSAGNISIEADNSISFQLPKLAFMFPENGAAVGQWAAVDIGLSNSFIQELETDYFYVDHKMIIPFFKKREKFGHKGTYGRALLIVGSYGMAGAATLSARAAMRSGLGLLDIYTPAKLYDILQIGVPEAMIQTVPEPHPKYFSIPPDTKKYQSVGIGCGLGQEIITVQGFVDFLKNQTKPLIIDADALNILAAHPSLLELIPANSILTPHPGEFKRLFGNSKSDFKRLTLQKDRAKSLNVYILLKGAHSCLVTPSGKAYFNSTGNPGMATAGSGDVLTGLITGLLAQSYTAFQSALLGMYLHGRAGDLASKKQGLMGLNAQDIIDEIPNALKEFEE